MVWVIKSKLPRRITCPLGFLLIYGNPHVNVIGGRGIAVECNGIAADQQIFNAIVVQQLQELFEVER